MNLFFSIVQQGVICVTLDNGKEWNTDSLNNLGDLIWSMATLFRAHDESRVKSERIKAVHKNAREQKNRSVFGRAPGWLRRTKDGQNWEPIPGLVEVVKRVFEMVASGHGGVSIARLANKEKWPVPSLSAKESKTTWHVTYPTKLVRNRAVIGELEFSISKDGKSLPTGQSEPDWYPRVVEDELFFRANAVLDARQQKPGRRDASYRNIFQGVIFCGHCGATLARKVKNGSRTSRNYATYVCTDRHRGVSKCPNYSAKELEIALIPVLYEHFSSAFGDDARLSSIREKIQALQGEQKHALELVAEMRELLIQRPTEAGDGKPRPPSPTILSILEEYEPKLPSIARDIERLTHELSAASQQYDSDVDISALFNALYSDDEDDLNLRAEVHTKMIMALDAIWIWPREMAVFILKNTPDHAISIPLHDPSITVAKQMDSGDEGIHSSFSERLYGAMDKDKNKNGKSYALPPRRRLKQAFGRTE
ncbi:hypothetical protein GCM10010970_23650 [Silvimonas iriomotensis]|uniref:Recombinase domain-containing protein n=2 Tax=Silvimonas iriomotensis TaxID=449662 RepID=A0ABQ2PB57_9NEIS|nr:hypothetical protein GCM10010970_23650 [Silvimonas iriomotensis]